jgi:hypothetical protein
LKFAARFGESRPDLPNRACEEGAKLKKVTGAAKWLSRLRAYGYINPDDDGNHEIKNGHVDVELANRGKDPERKNDDPRRN